MIINISFKTPDVVRWAVTDAVKQLEPSPVSEQDMEDLATCDGDLERWRNLKAEDLEEIIGRWVKYGEVVTIQIDTQNDCASVVLSAHCM